MIPAAARIRVPRIAVRPVRRDRLLRVLQEHKPVTVVSGPAGAGKTTLLASWAKELDGHVAWVTLDEQDNALPQLWSTIAQSLALAGIRDTSPEAAVLLDAISATKAPVYLILDEADTVRAGKALRGLEMLARQTPDNLRLVLAARIPPRVHLSRLRLEGRLLEIGMPELAFTDQETKALLDNHDIRVPHGELESLTRHTEGWPAAVRLATLSCGESTAFPADDPAMADYVDEEVLGPHPERVRQFLRATSICETVSADLATALSGHADSGDLLECLVRTNTLVERIDRSEYRYHPILRAVLLTELDRGRPSARRDLHQTAAEWFRDAGQPMAAMEHARSARNNQLTYELVEAYGVQEILNGNGGSLYRILSGLPANAHTALITASAAISVHEKSAADEYLAAVGSLRTAHLRALHSTVRLQRSQLDGRITDSAETLATAAAYRSGDLDLDTLNMITCGTALVRLGELTSAERILRRAMDLAADGCREYAVSRCMIQLASIAGARGDLARMDEEAAKAIDHAQDQDCSQAYALRGAVAYLRGDIEQLRDFTGKASEIDLLQNPTADRVRDWWHRTSPMPQLTAYVAPTVLRLALRADYQEWVGELVEHVGKTLPDTAEQALIEAISHAHRGKSGSARRILTPVLTGQVKSVAVTTRIHAWLLDATLLAETDDWHRAHSSTAKALTLAEPLSALRPFMDGGPMIRELLVKGAGRFGKLDHFSSAALRRLPATSAAPLDRLTSREQDLLVELPSMRTTEEIAESLFVSVNTVKTHLRGIYRKLGVNHRRDAVAVARRRGLL